MGPGSRFSNALKSRLIRSFSEDDLKNRLWKNQMGACAGGGTTVLPGCVCRPLAADLGRDTPTGAGVARCHQLAIANGPWLVFKRSHLGEATECGC